MLSAHHLVSDELFVGVGCVACCLMWCVMEFPVICGPGLTSERGLPGWTQFKDSIKSEVLAVFGLTFSASHSWPLHTSCCPLEVAEAKNVANLQFY